MRTKQILFFVIAFNCFVFSVNAQREGFTNKAEARNVTIKGVKQGKWVEYLDVGSIITTDTSAPYYRLVIYMDGKPYGIVREYHKGGILASETPYVDAKKNGVEKWYYKSGVIEFEIPFRNNVINGIEKQYYEDGKINWETPYADGIKNGVGKEYYENGKLKSETQYTDDLAKGTINFDENGNQIK